MQRWNRQASWMIAWVFAASPLAGQVIQSTILGSVTDAAGAVVPRAKVAVKNDGTNFERSMDTDEQGEYRISGLLPGVYRVTVIAAGFKTFRQTQVDLNMSQIKRVDAKLEVGDVSSTVTVEGGIGQVETETVTLSNLKTTRDYTQLPLSVFGRGWANIVVVVAGVQSNSGFEVNGARDTANNFTSDGISVNDVTSSRNTPNGFSTEIENIQEVKVMTANNSAEYPQVAQFAAVTKSGSNALHGSLYWGNFNSKWSTRGWRSPVAAPKPSFTNHNMFAITNGGPVRIPHLYDGRDKTFYFFSYGGARYRVGNRRYTTVPTPAFRQGDFSSILDSGAGRTPVVVTDPLNNGAPFAGNRIPSGRISPVSGALQDLLYPDPNLTGVGGLGIGENFFGDPGSRFDSDVYSYRVDHKVSNANSLFARVGRTATNGDTARGVLKQGYGQGNVRSNNPGASLVVSDTHIFSPSLVNEAKLGYSRWFSTARDINYGEEVFKRIGLQGIDNPASDPSIGGMPSFTINRFEGTNTGANGGSEAQNTYQAIDNVSWYRGRHTFKLGGDLRRYHINNQSRPIAMRGAFNFDDRLTGFSYASFLLGFPNSAQRAIPRPNAYLRSWQSGFYAQDDFRLHQRITVNYGVRYEYQTPWVDKFDRLFTFDPGSGSLVTAGTSIPKDLVPAVAATLPIISASQTSLPTRSLMRSDSNNWSPRVGMAIRPFGNTATVVRLGYGVYTQMWPGLLGREATGGPWQSVQTFILEGNNPTIRFPNPFLTNSSFAGLQSVSGVSPQFPNERTQQWSASVGRQLWGTAIDVAYVGTKAANIPYFENLNLLRPSTAAYSSARRPYQRFDSAGFTQAGGSSIYHGFTVQADRRMSKGLWFNANYTLAKALTDVDLRSYSSGSQQNQYQRFLERGDDPNIRRQQLRFSYVYELPVGHGRQFLSSLPGIAEQMIGGWQVSGITTMVTGARLSPGFSGIDPANTNQFGGRPDRVGDGNFDSSEMRDRIRSGQLVFDRNAFVLPGVVGQPAGRGFYGNSARTILTGPGSANWNFVVGKNFPLKAERARLQFRWEMFNALNRANFSAFPNTDIRSGTFGLVTGAASGRTMLFGLRLDY